MSSEMGLRDFINERLSAAAAEIFGMFKKTLVQYEEEIARQRKLLENSWKPAVQTHGAELQEPHVYIKEEDIFLEQLLYNQERMTNQNQDDPPKEEDQEELFTDENGKRLVPKEETDTSMETPSFEHILESEAHSEHHVYRDASSTGNQHETVSKDEDSTSVRNTELMANRNVDGAPESEQDPASGRKPVPCDICGKDFTYKYRMTRHRQIHTGEKPFSCETCGKSFRYNYHLADHMRIHTGEKPYVCKICGRSFSDPSALRSHTGVHTGKKPHACKVCGRCFRKRGNLTVHMKIHSKDKPFNCTHCGKCIQQSSVRSHMRVHHEVKRFSCETCGERFRYRHLMLSHMESVHEGAGVQLGNQV